MRTLAAVSLLCLAGLATGCDDNTFRIDPALTTDTVTLAALATPARPENADQPTALDIMATGMVIRGGRFPERAADAEQWDFLVRERASGGELELVPAGAFGLSSRPGLTRALQGQTFDDVVEAPGVRSFVTDSAVVLQTGAVYVARSRAVSTGFSSCVQYAKLQPLEIDLTTQRLRIQITTNERCGDPRLAMEG